MNILLILFHRRLKIKMQDIQSIYYNSDTDIFIFRWNKFSHCISISIWTSSLIVMDFSCASCRCHLQRYRFLFRRKGKHLLQSLNFHVETWYTFGKSQKFFSLIHLWIQSLTQSTRLKILG